MACHQRLVTIGSEVEYRMRTPDALEPSGSADNFCRPAQNSPHGEADLRMTPPYPRPRDKKWDDGGLCA